MLSKVIYWVVAVPLAAVIIVFSLNNRAAVILDLWPLDILAFPIPLFSVALVCMVAGFLIGGLIFWNSLLPSRRQKLAETMRADIAERDLLATRERLKALQEKIADGDTQITKFPQNVA